MKHLKLWVALMAIHSLSLAPAQAQKKQRNESRNVWGCVIDAFTHEQLRGSKVVILHAEDSTVVDSLTTSNGNYAKKPMAWVIFDVPRPGRYIARCSRDGYETTDTPFEIKNYKHETSVQLHKTTPFLLHKQKDKHEMMLDEVVVTATKVKFYHNGDTLVYNADAFELAEGSMLDALIRQLPGVELKRGGEILVNGRKVDALLLNGKEFFNHDNQLMLDNLPSYMVRNVKVYEQDDLLSRQLYKKENQEKPYMMDVQLKREYNSGWIGNGEGGAGTDEHFLARLFALRFTDFSRLTFFANANNINDDRKPGENGDWKPLEQQEGTKKTYDSGMEYQMTERNGKYNITGSARLSYTKTNTEQRRTTELFLPGGNNFGLAINRQHADNLRFSTRQGQQIIPKFDEWIPYFYFRETLEYTNNKGQAHAANATLNDNISESMGKHWMDSLLLPQAGQIFRAHAINQVLDEAKNNGHTKKASVESFNFFKIPHDGRFSSCFRIGAEYSDRVARKFDHYLLEYPRTPELNSDYRNRYDDKHDKDLKLTGEMTLFLHLLPEETKIEYDFTHFRRESNRSLYLLNQLEGWGQEDMRALGELPSVSELMPALDAGNSSHATQWDNTHLITLSQEFKTKVMGGTFSLSPKLNIRHEAKQLAYERGRLDTVLHRKPTFIQPVLSTQWFTDNMKTVIWPLSYALASEAPSMTYLVNLRDDSNPLYVMTGNPHLGNSHKHTLQSSIERQMSRQRMLHIRADLMIQQNKVAMGYVYDKRTGVKTVTPQTVNGNWTASITSGYTTPLDSLRHWTLDSRTGFYYYNSVDLVGTNGTAPQRSKVGSVYAVERLKLDYRPHNRLALGLKGNIIYRHTSGSRADFSTLDLYEFDYGMTALTELPWKLQLATDLTMYSRRGYADPAMNADELVWNARLSRRFLNGNLVCILDGFDLLGNLSNIQRSINAQGRMEVWNNVTSRYALLHIVYRLNKKPKKERLNMGGVYGKSRN